MNPYKKKKGSAIFIHVASKSYEKTKGDKKVLDAIKPSLDKLLKDLPGQKSSEKSVII